MQSSSEGRTKNCQLRKASFTIKPIIKWVGVDVLGGSIGWDIPMVEGEKKHGIDEIRCNCTERVLIISRENNRSGVKWEKLLKLRLEVRAGDFRNEPCIETFVIHLSRGKNLVCFDGFLVSQGWWTCMVRPAGFLDLVIWWKIMKKLKFFFANDSEIFRILESLVAVRLDQL